jgi:hypothetical protein
MFDAPIPDESGTRPSYPAWPQALPLRRGLIPGANDNKPDLPFPLDEIPPDPPWGGPGNILWLGTRDGLHGLGSLCASGVSSGGRLELALQLMVLERLLSYYGVWLGFEGDGRPLNPGSLRRLPVPAEAVRRVDYVLDIRRIGRRAQILVADGRVVWDGHTAAVLEGLTVTFKAPRRDCIAGSDHAPAYCPVA